MPTWQALKIDPERLKRTDEGKFLGPSGTFDLGLLGDRTAPGAKDLVETEVVGRLGSFIASYGGEEAFFDAVANEEKLADGVQKMLAYAEIHRRALAGSTGNDKWATDAEVYERKLKAAAKAFAAVAPHVLGLTSRTGPRTAGGAMASTMGRFDTTYP